jgi:hypothetical protein
VFDMCLICVLFGYAMTRIVLKTRIELESNSVS